VASLLPLNVSGHQLAVAAVPSGLVQLDTSTLKAVAAISLTAGATGLDLVDGSPQLQRDRNLLSQPTLYVATGAARLETVTVGIDGTLTDQGGFPMPGPITDVRWDRATNMVHVLGKVRDGTPTVYVVEPRDNSIFADAALPYEPVAWVLDSQPNDPGTDRQRILAFAQTGVMVAVDTGSNAFAWRLPGLVAGALLAGLLYLLAMLLFRRRSVGVIFAILLSIDGLLFQQSRIAMNDVYVALFAVAAFVVLAYMLGSRATGLRALAEGLLLPPLMGLLFGLALASKWPGLYAMAGAALIVLLRSGLGRWLALAGMVALTGVFGFQALADNPADLTFLVLMIGLTVALGVGIVRAGPIARPAPGEGPRWVDPRWRRGVPFVWVMGTMLLLPFAVYVASYIPWALSAAGGAQLYAGWPPGHTGQTFLDLQSAMYKYHNEWRFPHGASSPWWAWPFDLKPIWGYLESFLNGSQATVLGAGNPFLFWLAVPAAGFGMWQAWRRRSAALGFVAICLLALWLPWARIDRVAFNYHFYVAVPFAFLLLAYFLAELWDGASARTWLLARASVTVVLFAPALMWLGAGPLCAAAGVGSANAADAVCAAPLSSIPAWVGPWLVGALVASALIWRLLRPQWLVVGFLGAAGVAFAGLYPALAAWAIPNGLPSTYQGLLPTWDVGFQFASNQEPVALTPILGLGTLAVLVATAAITAVAMLRARPRPEPTGAPGAGTGPGRLRRSLRAILPYSSTTR
jgi:4-amino-4-deoxy-L-arabinose transferase-like glycosyltransferase